MHSRFNHRRLISLTAGAAVIFLSLFGALTSSFGWGENAERIIANKAVDTLPEEMQPFFDANRQYLVQHIVDPSATADASPETAHNSFIHLDHYGPFPFSTLPRSYTTAVSKYTRRTVDMYGLLPWQIGIYSQKLTESLQSRDWPNAKLNAAVLAHYVAAAHDPFNTTVDSGGIIAGQPGVNERYNSGLIDRFQLFFFIKPNEAAFVRDPTDFAFDMALTSHSWLENIFLADRHSHQGLAAYGDEYYDRFYAQAGAILVRQLSDAATDVGSYWMTAWINAGRPQLPAH
jgi:hypothetical protein